MVDRNGRWRRSGVVLGTIWSRGTGRYSLIVLGSWMVVALVSLFWTPQSLLATDGYHVWDKPSSAHWLGTDGTGADVLSWRTLPSPCSPLSARLPSASYWSG